MTDPIKTKTTNCAACGKEIPLAPIGRRPLCVSCRYAGGSNARPWHDDRFDGDGIIHEHAGYEPQSGSKAEYAFAQAHAEKGAFDFDSFYSGIGDGKADPEHVRQLVREVFAKELESARLEAIGFALCVLLDGVKTEQQAGRRAFALAYQYRESCLNAPDSMQELGKVFGTGKQRAHQIVEQTRLLQEKHAMEPLTQKCNETLGNKGDSNDNP